MPALSRRALAAGLLLPWGALAQGSTQYRFRLVRQGRVLGTHSVVLTRTAAGLEVRAEVDLLVRVLGITFFRLNHVLTEAWAGDRLLRASGREERNGSVEQFSAEAEGDGLRVRGSAGERLLPGNAAPMAWWDPRRPGRPLFDNANGAPLALDWRQEAQPDGGVLWRVTGAVAGETGFAPDGTWRHCRLTGDDGSLVTYEPA